MTINVPYTIDNNIYYNASPEKFIRLLQLIQKYPVSFSNMLKAKGRKKELIKNPNYIPKYKDLYDWINDQLPQLSDPYYKLSTKCRWILNGITDFPKCMHKECNITFKKNVGIGEFQGYPKFCCVSHAQQDQSVVEKRKQTNLERYGVEHALNNKDIQEKQKRTNLERYGYDTPLKCPRCRKLAKKTKLEKYGDENWHNIKKAVQTFKEHIENDPNFLKQIREKTKQTNILNGHNENWTNREKSVKTRLENHNNQYWTNEMTKKAEQTKNQHRVENPNYDAEILAKIQKTNLERYGVTCTFQSENVKNKLQEWISKNGGYINVFQTEIAKSKCRQTMRERYNAEYSMQSPEIKAKYNFIEINKKGNQTKLKNHTFNTSKPEEKSYELLVQVFSKPNVLRQYYSNEYPFNCDFYIKSKNLYIECNYNWTHGNHFFDPTNKKDIEQLEKWKAKNTKFYDIAIDVWTRRDKLKLQTAIDNKINYIVFWKIQDLQDWINNQYNINKSVD